MTENDFQLSDLTLTNYSSSPVSESLVNIRADCNPQTHLYFVQDLDSFLHLSIQSATRSEFADSELERGTKARIILMIMACT